MKINICSTALSLLIITTSIQAGKKNPPKSTAQETAETSQPPMAPSTASAPAASIAAVTQEQATPKLPTEHSPSTEKEPLAQAAKPDDDDDDEVLAPVASSKRFVEPTVVAPAGDHRTTTTTAPSGTTQQLPPIPMEDWDLGHLPPEQKESILAAFMAQLRRTATVSAETLNTIALALDLQTSLTHLGNTYNPQELATRIGAINAKKDGEGTTIAFNACREAMKTRNTAALKSLLQAIRMLRLERELGQTDKEAIDRYAREIAQREAEELEETMVASAEAIRELADMSRMVAPSGRNTPPATDATISACAQTTIKKIMDTASVNRF